MSKEVKKVVDVVHPKFGGLELRFSGETMVSDAFPYLLKGRFIDIKPGSVVAPSTHRLETYHGALVLGICSEDGRLVFDNGNEWDVLFARYCQDPLSRQDQQTIYRLTWEEFREMGIPGNLEVKIEHTYRRR